MKTIKHISLFIALTVSFHVFSQTGTSTSGGTLTVNASENSGNFIQRDEVDVLPGAGTTIDITPSSSADAHLYLDPTIILPTTYATGGVNTSGSSGSATQTLDPSLPVGATPGTYAVSNGSAMYTIPIAIPPGTNGMAPAVSIQYNSSALNGIAGHGWNLQATSSITRVNKNIYHDNVVQAVQLNSSDAFSLDGNRLIASSGTANNFISEDENFSLINYIPGSGTTGDYYTVQTVDGKTMEYGSTANSKMQFTVSGAAITYAWYLTKVYDSYGNTILYTYKQNPTTVSGLTYNEVVLSEIDYTLNNNPLVSPAITAYNSIKFDYEQRPDIESKYVHGNLIGSTLLLRQIEVDCESAFMKKYAFTYGQNALGESYLNSVQETGSDFSSLNPTLISYAVAAKPGVQNTHAAEPTNYSIDPTKMYFSGDFNGDGRMDMIGFINGGSPTQYGFSDGGTLYINNDNGLTYTTYANVLPTAQGVHASLSLESTSVEYMNEFNVVDVDGDGLDDVVFLISDQTGTTYYTYTSTGTGFQYKSKILVGNIGGDLIDAYFNVADINGDGHKEGALFYSYTYFFTGAGAPYFQVFDPLTGTSQSTNNFVDKTGNSPVSLIIVGASDFPPTQLLFGQSYSPTGLATIDFDGDGQSEFLVSDEYYYYVLDPQYSGGILQSINIIYKFNAFDPNIVLGTGYLDNLHVCDFNGDGISDYMVIPRFNSPFIYFGTGTGVTAATNINAPGYMAGDQNLAYAVNQNSYFIADINGDGKSDLINMSSSVSIAGNGSGISMATLYGSGSLNNAFALSAGTVINSGVCNLPTSVFNFNSQYTNGIMVGDFDGDGTDDVFYPALLGNTTGTQTNTRWLINPNAGISNHLATSIVDGNNVAVNFSYNTLASVDPVNFASNDPTNNVYMPASYYSKNTSLPAFPILETQRPFTIVSSMAVPSGAKNIGTLDNVTNYAYTDAEIQLQGKGFLGFGSVTETNATAGSTIVNSFKNISQVVSGTRSILEQVPSQTKETVVTAGTPFTSQTNYTYTIFTLNSDDDNLQHITPIVAKSETDYTGATRSTTYTYDNSTGNPTNNNLTNMVVTIPGVETQSVTNTYCTYTKFTYVPSRVQTSITAVSRQGQSAIYTRETDYTYTDEGSVGTMIQDPTLDNGAKKVTVAYTYFPTGNVNTKNTSSTDATAVAMDLAYTYEAKYRFPATYSNALQQISQYSYDPKWGKPLAVTGVDNLTTKYTYDGYGKNTTIHTPDGLTATIAYDWAGGDVGSWSGDPIDVTGKAQIKITTTKAGDPSTTVYYDNFGRTVRSITDGFNNPVNSVNDYDFFGNLYHQSNDFENNGNPVNKPLVTTYTYDNLARITGIVQKDAAQDQITATYSYGYNAGNTTLTANINPGAPSAKTITKTYDATGLLTTSGDNATALTYVYGAHHNPVSINLGGTVITTLNYDDYGRQTSIDEENSGTSTYAYNAYGQMNSQNDNSTMHQYSYTYDALGRTATMTSQGEGNFVYQYQYVTSGNGMNQLQKVIGPTGDRSYTYDALNRPTQVKEDIGTTPFITKYDYDQYSNIVKITYPGGFAITKSYDPHGYLSKINSADGNVIFQTNTIDVFGHFSNYSLGANINVSKTFTDFGYASNYSASAASSIQNYDFVFDPLTGNLGSRTDHTHGTNGPLYENFTYNNVDALSTVSGTTNMKITYPSSGNGNISNKSDVGDYTYDATKINAVTSVSNPYSNVPLTTQTVDYTAFKMPKIIKELDPTGSTTINELDYTYGPDQQRTQGILKDANGTLNTTYYQDNYEKIVSGSNANNFTETNYISGGDGICAVYVNDQNGNGNLYYVFTDHLGSILKVTYADGTKVAEQSFDAWGQPRDPTNWAQYNANNLYPNNGPAWLIRGYTGHEYLPKFNLVNMNARLYDPQKARILAVDNEVTDDENTQSFNRYSYCINNPLKYTDPTGNNWLDDAWTKFINFFKGGGSNALNPHFSNVTHANAHNWGKGKNEVKGGSGSQNELSIISRGMGDRSGGSKLSIKIFSEKGSGITSKELNDYVLPHVNRIFEKGGLGRNIASVIPEEGAPSGWQNSITQAVVPVRNTGEGLGESYVSEGRNPNYGKLNVDWTGVSYSGITKGAAYYKLDKYYLLAYTIAHEALHQFIKFNVLNHNNGKYPIGGGHYDNVPNLNKDGLNFSPSEWKNIVPNSPYETIVPEQSSFIKKYLSLGK